MIASLSSTLWLAVWAASAFSASAQAVNDYGVDCTFPIHSTEIRCNHAFADDRKQAYEDFMAGCRDYYGNKGFRCDTTEKDRIEMSIRQPQSMVNYTDTGFKKIKAPKEVMDLLYKHYELNKNNKKEEVWPAGNVYVNHWESPTYMLSVEDTSLRGGGYNLKSKIWDATKKTIEEWTQMELRPTSMYGIRVYTEGAVLNPHVDRLPLVSSCIINVAQDVDEDWILEVIDRQGRAVNVTMEPGDMVLYESGSLIHGRPFPLKGRFYANIFIHFEPTGKALHATNNDYLNELEELDGLPPYIVPGSPEEQNWRQRNPGGWNKPTPSAPIQQVHSPEGHLAAATGDVDRLTAIAEKNRKALHAKDVNGWQPIHEAVRAGHKDVVELLVRKGANVNARTGPTGQGHSVLNLAYEYLSPDHELITYLNELGARNIDAEL